MYHMRILSAPETKVRLYVSSPRLLLSPDYVGGHETIDILRDDVFLQIVHFDRIFPDELQGTPGNRKWQRLVHVCRLPKVPVPCFRIAKRSRPETFCGPKTR